MPGTVYLLTLAVFFLRARFVWTPKFSIRFSCVQIPIKLPVIIFFDRDDGACGRGRGPEKMPRYHASGGAEGGQDPGGEQPHIKQDTDPGKQGQTGMVRQLRRAGDAGADRKGKGPISEGELHVSVVGPQGQKNRETGPEDHKPENGDTVKHGKQFKAASQIRRQSSLGNRAQDAGGGHGLSQGSQHDPQGRNTRGAGSAVMRQPTPDHRNNDQRGQQTQAELGEAEVKERLPRHTHGRVGNEHGADGGGHHGRDDRHEPSPER